MIDFLSKQLPALDGDTDVEVDEAQAKRERIAFHRDHVRNGPVKFPHVTSGQIRRAKARDLASRAKKARRKQVQNYFAAQREYATLRGHLQAVGVLPYALRKGKISEVSLLRSARWIVQNFGSVELSESEILKDAIQKAYDRFCVLTGQETSAVEYAD